MPQFQTKRRKVGKNFSATRFALFNPLNIYGILSKWMT